MSGLRFIWNEILCVKKAAIHTCMTIVRFQFFSFSFIGKFLKLVKGDWDMLEIVTLIILLIFFLNFHLIYLNYISNKINLESIDFLIHSNRWTYWVDKNKVKLIQVSMKWKLILFNSILCAVFKTYLNL